MPIKGTLIRYLNALPLPQYELIIYPFFNVLFVLLIMLFLKFSLFTWFTFLQGKRTRWPSIKTIAAVMCLVSKIQFTESQSNGKSSMVSRKMNDIVLLKAGSSEQQIADNMQDVASFARRRLLAQSKNLPAVPATGMPSDEQIISLPTTRSSGSFPAVLKAKKQPSAPSPSPPDETSPTLEADSNPGEPPPEESSESGSGNLWKYLIIIPIVVIVLAFLAFLFLCRKRAAKTIGPWKTGLSGQLQKAFVTGYFKTFY